VFFIQQIINSFAPNFNYKIEKMKKLLVIAIAAFAFTACNNGAKTDEGTAKDSTAAEATPATPEATPATPEATPATPEATPATPEAAPATEAAPAEKTGH
jgi:hypothetical protein